MSAGSTPSRRSPPNRSSTPMSAISTLRMPAAAARRMSSSCQATSSWPRATPPTAAPPGARAIADGPQAAFGRANSDNSTRAAAAVAAISASSASVSMNTPLPCDTRVHGDLEPRRLLEHRAQAGGPLGAGDLDAVLRAVGKALSGRRQVVQVARRQPRPRQAGAPVERHRAHHPPVPPASGGEVIMSSWPATTRRCPSSTSTSRGSTP